MGFDEIQKQIRRLVKGENNLSKSQRIILLYIGITSKIEKKKSLSKKEIKDGLSEEVGEKLDTKSFNSLVRRDMIEEYDGSYCLSDDGKDSKRITSRH